MNTTPYDFGDAQSFMDNFELELERRNPGASATLAGQGVSVFDMGRALREHIPFIISRTYEPHASETVLAAQLSHESCLAQHAVAPLAGDLNHAVLFPRGTLFSGAKIRTGRRRFQRAFWCIYRRPLRTGVRLVESPPIKNA